MALYHVERTDFDEIKPGEFVNADVIAGGAAIARRMVAHLEGVQKDGKNVKATKIDVGKASGLRSVYFDERDLF